jgi:hypothetical protein
VLTGNLDEAGSLYEFNKLVDANKVMVREGCEAIAELNSADRDNFSPLVKCILRLTQETRTIHREIPKPLTPFEAARKRHREKLFTNSAKKNGWII